MGYAVKLVLLCAILTVQPDQAFPAKKKAVTKMDFNEFAETVKGKDSFELTVSGSSRESYFTGKSYIHYETVAYFGKDEIKSAYQILYHTQEDFTVLCGAVAADVRYGQVRTHLNPSFERTYRKEEFAQPRSEKEKSLRLLIDSEEAGALLLAEYGLEAGKIYHGRIKTESYHLPPREHGGRTVRREKKVLVISDRAFPNDSELTPLYRGWSY